MRKNTTLFAVNPKPGAFYSVQTDLKCEFRSVAIVDKTGKAALLSSGSTIGITKLFNPEKLTIEDARKLALTNLTIASKAIKVKSVADNALMTEMVKANFLLLPYVRRMRRFYEKRLGGKEFNG